MLKQLDKVYDPQSVEDRTYQFWLSGGYFHAEPDTGKPPYTIVIPPPNVTGQLHMGHALDETLQDILIRWRRMQGYEALWLPGTDHAAIATEAKVVAALKKEGVTKEMLGREKFLERAWEWKEKYENRILSQLKKIGCSCDWDRLRFTMDEGCSEAVQEVFMKLYNKGLIYRGERMINWCPNCKTSLSDAEVEHEEKEGAFWHICYPIVGEEGKFIEIATTRPETMLGDTAVAVHPDDERYKALVGKNVLLPIVNKEIPIIADEYVEMDFGTGVVKITPAHDPNDFEVGQRHNLEVINLFTEDAHIVEGWGKYSGMDRMEARKAIVADLEEGGYLIKTEPYSHNVGTCYRCGTVVEPRVSKQWFVKMKPLAGPAIDAVKDGRTKFIPERFDKTYFHWLEDIHDWCISRQIWWGHRIPAYYCDDCGEMVVSREPVCTCPKCGGKMHQDPDTLDTWFSSALWPFSTLGWPKQTAELKYFYPTATLVTGYDIIFFWVVRMMFSGMEHMGEVPFKNVLIHGLVRDAQGRKMSKSLGNGIDPLEIIDQYGADALRFTLATGNSPGNDMRFSDDKVKASRNFANKIWNASRFILMNLPEDFDERGLPAELAVEDKWLLTKYNRLITEVTDNLEAFELGMAVQKLYDFIWDILCDWYIELTKSRMAQGGESRHSAQMVLCYVINGTMRLLHPFMPFITEEIWQALPHDGETIMKAEWPKADESLNFAAEEAQFEKVMDLIRAIRNRRAEMGIPPSKKAHVYVETKTPEIYLQAEEFIKRLASASEVEAGDHFEVEGAVQVITSDARGLIPMAELIDRDKELARLNKEKAACQKDIDMLSGKLSNPGFTGKAPAAVVDGIRDKLAKAEERMKIILESIANLG